MNTSEFMSWELRDECVVTSNPERNGTTLRHSNISITSIPNHTPCSLRLHFCKSFSFFYHQFLHYDAMCEEGKGSHIVRFHCSYKKAMAESRMFSVIISILRSSHLNYCNAGAFLFCLLMILLCLLKQKTKNFSGSRDISILGLQSSKI